MTDLPGPGARPVGPDARGAQGVQSGESNLQINVYAKAESVEWPHQVGSVPQLADCYQHRERETARLDEAASTGTAVLTQVLSGLGGVGKTQLAASYARRIWAENGVELLVWVTASTRQAVQETYARAAEEIGYLPAQDFEWAAKRFLGWLENTNRAWLVVLDDVADPADLRGLWPPTGPRGRTVVTTRRREAVLTDHGRRLIDIDVYTATEAVAYLRDKLGAARTGAMAEAAELAHDLGYLPLALAQAATFIEDRGETCAGYRRRLSDRRRLLSEILPADDALADDYGASVAATWSISVDHADKLAPVGLARPVLQLLSTLDRNGVPIDIVISPAARTVIAGQCALWASDGHVLVEEQDCRDALANLHRLSLISLDPAGGARAISTHALVQRATLEELSPDAVSTTVRAAADALVQVWPAIERDTELGRVLRDCTASLRERHGELLWDPHGHAVLFRAGRSLVECGLVGAAVGYWTEMEAKSRDALGDDHPDTLTIRNDLAYCRGVASDPVGAAAAFEQLLDDRLRVLGADHPDTLNTRNTLAYWRGAAGDPAGAAEALKQLLEDRLRMLGADHPDTLNTRNNLARWRGEAGDPAGAIADLEQLLADYLRVLGPDHPHTLDARHTLAYRRGEAGDPVGAIADLEQLLADHLRVLGPDHPNTLNARNNLARWRGHVGDPAGAVAELELLLADRQRVLPDHPDTLTTRSDLALWRGEAGDPAGAVADLERLLIDCLQVLGGAHPGTLMIRHDLARWRGEAGDPAGAVADLEQLLTDYLEVLGPVRPHTLITRHTLAYWRGQGGDPAGAVDDLEQLLTDRLRVLDRDHPHILRTRGDLARWRGEAGDPARAVSDLEQLLTDYLRVLGADHPDTLTARGDRADLRGKAGDPAGAAEAYEQLLTDRLRVLGAGHHHTLGTRRALARWRGEAGDAEDTD